MIKVVEIMMADGCTEDAALRLLRCGTIVYDRPADYIRDIKDSGYYTGETLEGIRAGLYEDVSMVTVDGHEYLIDYWH